MEIASVRAIQSVFIGAGKMGVCGVDVHVVDPQIELALCRNPDIRIEGNNCVTMGGMNAGIWLFVDETI